ncbi:MAG: amidohydrolase family protein [Caulobacteraceae bacterium]
MDQPMMERPAKAAYKRIATEEAFCPAEMIRIWKAVLDGPDPDPGFVSLIGFYMTSQAERPRHIMACLTDLGEMRLRHMDEAGIDRQVMALTSPGVQVMAAADAAAFAKVANDELSEACRRHPDRFSGMVAIAPHSPAEAAREIERGVQKLGLTGVIVNSHTHGEYLSDPKFWEIFEAAEANDTPIYLHPNTPPRDMIRPYLEAGLDGAIFGFAAETGLHALRLITAGVFDRFPRLQVVLGHLGEALPFWAYRLDYMHAATVRSKRYEVMQPLKKKPSDYLRENFHITNSGVAWEPGIKFVQDVVGVDRVLYAMDYPYQHSIEEVHILDGMDMTPEVKKAFFQTNAEKLFKLV